MGQVRTREAKHRVLPHLGKGAQAIVVAFQPKVDLVASKASVSQVRVVILCFYDFNINNALILFVTFHNSFSK